LNNGIVNFAKKYLIMQEASFSGFIRTLFYIIAFYYIFKFLARLFLPILVKKAVEKAGENFQRQQQYSQQTNWNKTRNNDEIIIDATNAKKSRETKKVGDYVDYEEID
jgi:DNA integrity scanning protein DisA with diadenylate cyclase activity